MTADLSSLGRCLFSQLRAWFQVDAMTPEGHLCLGPCREAWDGAPLTPPGLNRTLNRKKKKKAQSGYSLLRRKRNSERDVVKHCGRLFLFFLHEGTDAAIAGSLCGACQWICSKVLSIPSSTNGFWTVEAGL